MTLNSPLYKVPLKFGAFGALIVLIMFFLLFLTGENPLTEMGMFDFFVIPIFLFFAIKEFRDTYNGRLIEFWQGMTVGFVTYTSLALITTLVLFVFLQAVDSEIFDNYVISKVEEVTNAKEKTIEQLGEVAYSEALAKVKTTSRSDLILDYLLKKLIVGLMLTIMIAVIMRRKPKEEDTLQ